MKKIIIAILLASTTLATYTKTLNCENNSKIDMGHISIQLNATIEKIADNDYIASDRTLDFIMGEEDQDWVWYKYNGDISKPLENVKNYRPRKYKGHIKFAYDYKLEDSSESHVYNRRFFGNFDFIVPVKALDEATSGDTIYAPVIMSYVSDHWGGSRTLKCIVK